jgi:hypothetical protein
MHIDLLIEAAHLRKNPCFPWYYVQVQKWDEFPIEELLAHLLIHYTLKYHNGTASGNPVHFMERLKSIKRDLWLSCQKDTVCPKRTWRQQVAHT